MWPFKKKQQTQDPYPCPIFEELLCKIEEKIEEDPMGWKPKAHDATCWLYKKSGVFITQYGKIGQLRGGAYCKLVSTSSDQTERAYQAAKKLENTYALRSLLKSELDD